MYLTRHLTAHGPRWAADGHFLPEGLDLSFLLKLSESGIRRVIETCSMDEAAAGELLPPVESSQEVWAAGVTYLRSREARMAESETKDIYEKVYDADRVEVFFKGAGWRIRGMGQPIRVRTDSQWNVPEPELAIVVNASGDIVGYTVGNDVSSRDIEGANPLYLPQAKIYDGSCAIGPGIVIDGPQAQRDLPIHMTIERAGGVVYEGETNTSQLKRSVEDIADWLMRELTFPEGVIVLTGTCLVPPDEFTLSSGDRVRIRVGDLVLDNPVGD
ncbi:MAG: fumarylacetoacetate hydrolase [Candidatus Entotheonella factor]|uniref:Fumarylacetoacetate hydrolase n=2 Tax=Candidatus Entotheonella TaxID=93171 RepID=W4LGK8_ENTF1|nr:MAG: fumarylacetoacetate hydrolase [Candidatus Entotheonella factor]